VLGAVVHQEDPGAAVLSVAGISILLVTPGQPTPDKPTVTFVPPPSREVASHTLSLLVADCRAVHEALVARGATFLTPPYDFGDEVRAYTRDPDGHLVELSEIRESG
jgi:catechol 2,3-dioxygenase-like lactoylglutathione lyase family enzyme